jgi:RHS repeat-associated protein
MIDGATLSYVHPDHLDRPVAMTTSGGPAVAWSAKYDPFGNVVTITSPTAMPLRFPGQVFQIEDGLSYNWHRNYDPTLGRYSQADPLGFVDGPGVYNYAAQSALMWVDPSGLTQNPTSPPPPKNIPGSPWRWSPNPGDGRGGKWFGPDGQSGGWDPDGHFDVDDGCGNRQRYNRHGAPISPEEAHSPYNGPKRLPFPRWAIPIILLPTSPSFWCDLDNSAPSCNET